MAFVHARSTRVLLGEHAASAQLHSLDAQNSRAMSEATCFPDAGQRWRPGLRTGTLTLAGRFDGDGGLLDALVAAGGVDDALLVTAGLNGFAPGAVVFTSAGDLATHGTSSSASDVVGVSVESTSDERTWIGVSLHDAVAETSSGNGPAIDHGTPTASGAMVVVHLTALTGTAATAQIVVQHSADDLTYVDLATFDAASSPGAQRRRVTGTVQRYVRASWTLSGTTPAAAFAVVLARS